MCRGLPLSNLCIKVNVRCTKSSLTFILWYENEFLALIKKLLFVLFFKFILLFFLIEIEDLKDVVEYVFELNMTQFIQLGLQLGLLQPTLDELTDGTKLEDYGTKVMTEWLNQVDKAQPTWNNLAKALDKRTVKAHVQAAQIREELKNGTLN